MSGMNYNYGKCKDGVNDVENEKYVTLGCDKIETIRILLLRRHTGKIRQHCIEKALTSRIRIGWRKFKQLSDTLCTPILFHKLYRLYKPYMRSIMCYGAECWAKKMADIRQMQTTEMRMI